LHEGVLPLDMDTADLAGDAFFDLRSKVTPIECASNSTSAGGDCSNGEVTDHDLVITKLTLTVRAPQFGEYARCNICLDSGLDPMSHLPCTPGAYICTCGEYWSPRDCTNDTSVGAENITQAFGRFASYSCNWDRWTKEPWTCWSWPVVSKTGGMWYSTTKAGWCGGPDADPSTCTWDAVVEKVINKTCSDKIIYDAIESYDRKHDRCFEDCPARRHHPAARNVSDPCWIYCYYSTLLGASRLLPSGAHAGDTGMPRELITSAFSQPFQPVAQGGCPAISPPPPKAAGKRGALWRARQRITDELYRTKAQVAANASLAKLAVKSV